jgi:hypothetical protein
MKYQNELRRWLVLATAFVAAVALIACGAFWGVTMHRDKAAVLDYIARVQPQLSADERFKDVHLLGYLGIPFRYRLIKIDGHVASQKDKDALNVFIRESKPPLDVAVGVVRIVAN